MSSPTTNARYYSAPPANIHSMAATYIWDPNAVQSGAAQPVTGNWRPYTAADIGVSLAGETSNYASSGNAGTLVAGQVLAANPNRTQAYIQNVGTGGPLYVKLGPPSASQQSFSLVLKAASSEFGPDGGIWVSDGFWTGPVSASGTTRFISWEV